LKSFVAVRVFRLLLRSVDWLAEKVIMTDGIAVVRIAKGGRNQDLRV
jgi:hypothetical protein